MMKKVFHFLPFAFHFLSFSFYLLSIAFFLLPLSCSNPFANQSLSMTADPGVTEAWISLHVDGVKSGADYIVQRDGSAIFSGRLQSPDTVVYDSLLQPATTYTYRFFARENGDDSPALQSSLTTMDTTSHNFSWQSYEFGGQNGSSYFNDVAIIDENDIWAVGEIHTDSTDRWNKDGTEWLQPYNAAHWDGNKWTLKRIPTNACGGVKYPSIKSVFYFIDGTIVFGHSDGSLTYYDGSTFKNDCATIYQVNVTANKIWGTSSNDFYVVGNSGMIAHYDGKSWMKIETGTGAGGTDQNLRDVSGDGSGRILYSGMNIYNLTGIVLMQNTGSTVKVYDNGMDGPISAKYRVNLFASVLTLNKNIFYIAAGQYVFKVHKTMRSWVAEISFKGTNGIYRIRGNNVNDIFVTGDNVQFKHFNGTSWKAYPELNAYGHIMYSLDVKDNVVAAVGKSTVIVGKRE